MSIHSSKAFYIILPNIRSLYNVGAIFRSADAFGVTKIFLTGYTPTPHHHRSKISKTALGAEKSVSWEKHMQTLRLIKKLKQEGVQIIALEKSSRHHTTSLEKFQPEFPLALIMGNEVRGLGKNILDASDAIISISMQGIKESLNVSVAAGIAIHAINLHRK